MKTFDRDVLLDLTESRHLCRNTTSIAEGDSGDEDDDGDIILENECLTSFEPQGKAAGSDTNFNRNSAAVTLLPQSISLPNSFGATLGESPAAAAGQNGNSNMLASSSQGLRKDGDVITLWARCQHGVVVVVVVGAVL